MSVISRIKQLAKLKRKPYRDAYVEEHVKTSLPFQIRALREQRGWSQSDLGEKTGMRQNAISRLEKPDYGSLSVNTLIRLASAFDVALLIKFVPFRKLLDEFSDLSTEALEVSSFDDELPELEQVAAMPTWYQGSYARATYVAPKKNFDFDVTVTYEIDKTNTLHQLRDTWEVMKQRVKFYRGTYIAGKGALVSDPLQDVDEMPVLDYTGEGNDLDVTANSVYYQSIRPFSSSATHVQ